MKTLFVVALIHLTGPDQQRIDVNPAEVSSVREPRGTHHFAPGTNCLLAMTNGHFITVAEDCDKVRLLIEGASNEDQ